MCFSPIFSDEQYVSTLFFLVNPIFRKRLLKSTALQNQPSVMAQRSLISHLMVFSPPSETLPTPPPNPGMTSMFFNRSLVLSLLEGENKTISFSMTVKVCFCGRLLTKYAVMQKNKICNAALLESRMKNRDLRKKGAKGNLKH